MCLLTRLRRFQIRPGHSHGATRVDGGGLQRSRRREGCHRSKRRIAHAHPRAPIRAERTLRKTGSSQFPPGKTTGHSEDSDGRADKQTLPNHRLIIYSGQCLDGVKMLRVRCVASTQQQDFSLSGPATQIVKIGQVRISYPALSGGRVRKRQQSGDRWNFR